MKEEEEEWIKIDDDIILKKCFISLNDTTISIFSIIVILEYSRPVVPSLWSANYRYTARASEIVRGQVKLSTLTGKKHLILFF